MSQCVDCKKPISHTEDLCLDCGAKHGRRKDWPKWVTYLVQQKQKKRMARQRGSGEFAEIVGSDLLPGNSQLPSEGGLGRAFSECEDMGVDWESTDWDAY